MRQKKCFITQNRALTADTLHKQKKQKEKVEKVEQKKKRKATKQQTKTRYLDYHSQASSTMLVHHFVSFYYYLY